MIPAKHPLTCSPPPSAAVEWLRPLVASPVLAHLQTEINLLEISNLSQNLIELSRNTFYPVVVPKRLVDKFSWYLLDLESLPTITTVPITQ